MPFYKLPALIIGGPWHCRSNCKCLITKLPHRRTGFKRRLFFFFDEKGHVDQIVAHLKEWKHSRVNRANPVLCSSCLYCEVCTTHGVIFLTLPMKRDLIFTRQLTCWETGVSQIEFQTPTPFTSFPLHLPADISDTLAGCLIGINQNQISKVDLLFMVKDFNFVQNALKVEKVVISTEKYFLSLSWVTPFS